MSDINSVITALLEAVEKAPDSTPLRLHLASVLAENRRYDEALQHVSKVLLDDPANPAALKQAADLCEKLGDLGKAASYRKLLNAIHTDDHQRRSPMPKSDDWADVIEERPELDPFSPSQAAGDLVVDIESSDLRLTDVAGMETVKRRLNLAFLSPLRNPDMMKLYGKSLRGGLLLYGPPGCGKTFIARAVAGELDARFISVGLADVLDMWIGNSEKNIHSVFERARRNAPCVLFFDELDALGRKRSLTRNTSHGAINQLLSELDGLDGSNQGVFVLAATNHPWDVDTALRRPGRLDRTVLVLPPDDPAREGILDFHLRDRPTDATVDTRALAEVTDGYSGADLAHLVESAAELAMEDSLNTGNVRSIAHEDFKRALLDVRPSTRPWFEVAKNYALFANDGGVYDDLIEYLKQIRLM